MWRGDHGRALFCSSFALLCNFPHRAPTQRSVHRATAVLDVYTANGSTRHTTQKNSPSLKSSLGSGVCECESKCPNNSLYSHWSLALALTHGSSMAHLNALFCLLLFLLFVSPRPHPALGAPAAARRCSLYL
jgi:hypothetical protein